MECEKVYFEEDIFQSCALAVFRRSTGLMELEATIGLPIWCVNCSHTQYRKQLMFSRRNNARLYSEASGGSMKKINIQFTIHTYCVIHTPVSRV